MKKKAFTLAEILITLGIIGVVAALTAPALIQNVGSAQVGPKLAKARSTLELANQNLMSAHDANKLTKVLGMEIPDASKTKVNKRYVEMLSDYMKIQELNSKISVEHYDYNGEESINTAFLQETLIASNNKGIVYAFYDMMSGNGYISPDGMIYYFSINNPANPEDKPHKQYAGSVVVDINGIKEPNRFGRDTFVFFIMNDGSLKALGDSSMENEDYHWKNSTVACNKNGVSGRGFTCTGSIFENGLKVIYN